MGVISHLSLMHFLFNIKGDGEGVGGWEGEAQSWTSIAFTETVERFTPCVWQT